MRVIQTLIIAIGLNGVAIGSVIPVEAKSVEAIHNRGPDADAAYGLYERAPNAEVAPEAVKRRGLDADAAYGLYEIEKKIETQDNLEGRQGA